MEALFKKYFWVVQGIGLAVIAGLAASAVVTQLGTAYALDVSTGDDEDAGETDGEGDEDGDDAASKKKRKSKSFGSSAFNQASSLASTKRKTAEDVQKHNVFCPTCVPVTAEATATETPVDLGRPDGIQPGEVKSSLALQLMATMESTDPDFSLATIYDADAAVTGAYRRGDAIRSGVIIVGVDTGLVHLRNGASLEYLSIDDEAAPPARASSTTTKKKDEDKPKKKSKYAIDGADEAINCPDENTCVVDRAFVEQLMANPAMLAKQARIVPSQRDGETQGFKFYGIRRGSLPKLLGLKNGDMLTEVNGEEIRSVDKAMALAMKLRRASNLSVTLVRKGKTMTKEIQIQ
ncbi:MAG: type II secretion system protein GspC [Myxococcota bacterium]